MNNELDDLKNRWNEAKKNTKTEQSAVNEVIARANEKQKQSLYFQYGNVVVLLLVLVMVIVFFYYLFPFQDTLSKIGVALMWGGLALRIAIELFSILKSKKISITDHVLKSTTDTVEYFQFRKKIHGPVTVIIVGFYIAGVLMLTPEFAKHFGWTWILLVDAVTLVAAVLIIWQIKKGIREEMRNLGDIVALRDAIAEE